MGCSVDAVDNKAVMPVVLRRLKCKKVLTYCVPCLRGGSHVDANTAVLVVKTGMGAKTSGRGVRWVGGQ